MVVWSFDFEVPIRVSSLMDSAFDSCVPVTGSGSPSMSDHNLGHSTVLCPTVNVDICSVSVPVYPDAPVWYITYLYGHKVPSCMLVVT